MTSDAKLLPCPFCGGPASFGTVKYSPKHVQEQGWNQDTFHFVSCIKCGVSNCGIVGHDTMILAAELWNHRELIGRREADAPVTAREAELEAEIERLTKARDNLSRLEQSHREQANEQFHRAEKAEAENQRLRQALKPFANAASSIERVCGPRDPDDAIEVRFDALDAARAALSSTGEKG